MKDYALPLVIFEDRFYFRESYLINFALENKISYWPQIYATTFNVGWCILDQQNFVYKKLKINHYNSFYNYNYNYKIAFYYRYWSAT